MITGKHVKAVQRRKDILDGIAAGMPLAQIAEYVGVTPHTMDNICAELVRNGQLARVSPGKFALPLSLAAIPSDNGAVVTGSASSPNGKHEPVESVSRRVEIPDFMKARPPVIVALSYGEDEIENVLKLELLPKDGRWFAVPCPTSLRLYLGQGTPRWSPTQESYERIEAYRLTFSNGEQKQYGHNPDDPLTIDQRLPS